MQLEMALPLGFLGIADTKATTRVSSGRQD